MSASTCGKRHHFERVCEQDEQGRKVFYWRCRDCGQEARGREEMIKHADSYYGDVTSAWDPEIMRSAEIDSFEINYEIGKGAVQNIKYLPGKLICNKAGHPFEEYTARISKAPDFRKTVELDITEEEDREIRRALENTDFVSWCEGGYPPLPYVEPRRNDPIGIPPPIIRFICTFANRPYTYYTRLSEGKEYEGHSIIDPLRKILERYGIAFMPVYVYDRELEKVIQKSEHIFRDLEEAKDDGCISSEGYGMVKKCLDDVIERLLSDIDSLEKRWDCRKYSAILFRIEMLHMQERYAASVTDKVVQERIESERANILRHISEGWQELDVQEKKSSAPLPKKPNDSLERYMKDPPVYL